MRAIRDMLREAAHQLDSDDASREASILLAHALGKSSAWLVAHAHDEIGDDARAAFDTLVARRVAGEPIAYLVGTRGFRDIDLEVTPNVLIPRPETELLVELALQRIPVDGRSPDAAERNPGIRPAIPPDCAAARLHPGYTVADLGTGSGAVALAIAKACPHAQVLATDASDAAIVVARQNARRLGLTNVAFVQGDWCAALGGQRFDLIVSNPPYIADSDPHLREGDLRFEPSMALSSGPDGLDAIRTIVRDAATHLKENGWLLFEHGFEQGPAVRGLLDQCGYREVFTDRDLEGRERVSGGRSG